MEKDLRDAGDATLVVAVGRWREEALAEIYRRHAGPIFALALRVVRDKTIAEDVVQEIFLQLWNHPERFDPDRGTLRSFMLAQTHGKSVDILRSDTSRRKREEREARVRQVTESAPDPESEAWRRSLKDQVREALGLLNADERQAIELAYFAGHTYREVAELLEQPEGTIKSRIRAALRRLRVALAEVGLTA